MHIHNLVETHCHILPGIDDGSPDIETSLKMINRLQTQGAEAIILTPHYYSDSISLDDFVKRRDDSFGKLIEALPEGSPKLIAAAEVYISDYLFHNDSLDKICIGNSRYALIEHSFSSSFSQKTYDRLLNLNYEFNIRPILAHIERYRALMEDEELLDEYIDMGCLVQVNISSFSDSPKNVRKKLFRYLESGRIHLVGSDCHNLSSRAPDYENGAKEIIKKYGRNALETLEKNAGLLIK